MPTLMHRHIRVAAVLLFLAVLWATVHYSGLEDHFSVQFLHDSFERHKLGGLLIYTALFVLGNLVQIPGWIFLLGAVLALGKWWGGLATYVAACVACATTYWLVRLLGGAGSLRTFGGRLGARIFARLDAHPLQSVCLLRLVFQTAPPVNWILALSGVRFGDYLLGTALGLPLPIVIYCVFIDTLANWLHWTAA
jgi:uncharacterized membrane protein YdjX (TVP38/TMEM64 family)